MSFWTPENIRASIAGAWLARPAPAAAGAPPFDGLSIDTRTLRPGEIFLALHGARFDGHDFLAAAVAGGSPLLIVQEGAFHPAKLPPNVGIIKVADTARALLRLAATYRRALETTRVIAVTGSNGKTTTTRLIHSVLSHKLRGSMSPKSFNNAVGVPLTILRAKPGDQFLVCEVGINAPGEMAELAEVIQPDIAVITSIGRAHMEGFSSVETVCREKASLLTFLRPNGCAVVTADAPGLSDFLRPVPNLVTFGRSDRADLRLTSVEHIDITGRGMGLRFTINERSAFETPLLGEHNALNAMAAIGVARRFGLDNTAIAEGLLSAAPPEMRLALKRRGDIVVINDAYNANPDSMLAAIRAFPAITPHAKRRVAIIGDMLELGDHAADLHREIGQAIIDAKDIEVVIAVGPLALHIAERLERVWDHDRVHIVPTLSEKSLARIAALIRPGDAVLLKGSRGVGLEQVDQALASRSTVDAVASRRA